MADDDHWRIDHTGIGVSDITKAAKFYDAALGALGLKRVARITKTFGVTHNDNDPELAGVAYGVSFPIFWIDLFHPHGVKQHTAFRARSRDEVQAFHRVAIASGGQDHGAPGVRSGGYPPGYFAAFVLDPDGNNIEAVLRES